MALGALQRTRLTIEYQDLRSWDSDLTTADKKVGFVPLEDK